MWFDSIHHCRCGWYQFILLKLERTDLLSSAVSPNQINLTNRLKKIPIHADVAHVTTNVTVKHWNAIPLCRPSILPASVTRVENVSTYVNKSGMVDCPRITSFDASSTADPDPIDAFKSYDEIEGSTLFFLPILKKNVEVFVSLLFMIFVLTLE